MKLFCFYLPQFHTIPENDEWWGRGFTEWTNVKKAKPLSKNHVQPKHPLNGNYYNLLEKSTVEWQTGLMNDYDVDGMIYYHYYFKGRLLLEKPAENLLKWTDIDQPFFFCWANHTWYRSWEGSKEVLIKQIYGDKADWEKHFQYLLPFFSDRRYEKKENKPLFMVFHPDFDEKKEMFLYFDKRCRDEGFAGICLIETFWGERGYGRWKKALDAARRDSFPVRQSFYLREYVNSSRLLANTPHDLPLRIKNKLKRSLLHKNVLHTVSADQLYEMIIQREPVAKDLIHGLFFEWDNTPRHGYRGSVVTPPAKKKFMELMNHLRNEEYIFINAWNEWAEGMIMEPTEETGYRYLEWIREWKDSEKSSETGDSI